MLTHRKTWGRFVVKTAAFSSSATSCADISLRRLNHLSHLYDFDKALNVQVYTGSYHEREIFPKAWLGNGKPFPFEDTTGLLPAEYDKYLSHFFGNYMQLPPVEQRVEKHLRYYLNMEKRETWQEISKKLL